MKNLAKKYFIEGYSCSESIMKAAIDKSPISEEIMKCSTAFSGGMGSGCLCGAVAAAQIVISARLGRTDVSQDASLCREKAKQLIEEFKKRHKFTCCKALTAGFDFYSKNRKLHCTQILESVCDILENILETQKLSL